MTKRMILCPQAVTDIAIKGVVFDMDGTLCLPQTWMFKEMRREVGLEDPSIDILKFVDSLNPEEQVIAKSKIAAVEQKAMKEMQPQPGLTELMEYLKRSNIPKSICTRNLMPPVNHLLTNFANDHVFEPIITRDFTPPKPDPAPILHIAKNWGVNPKNIVMVGDSIDDVRAANSAGAATILIKTHANEHVRDLPQTDITVDSLADIVDRIENGFYRKE